MVMQSPRCKPKGHEAEEYPAMRPATAEIRIVPLASGRDVLPDLLRDVARRLPAQAIEAEAAACFAEQAPFKDEWH